MTNLKKRERAKTNASLISMVQRFSDITIMFAGLWLVCEVSGLSFLYMHLLVALITLVVFQMLGGITDFYRSWRGVRAATEFALLLQNWTLSVIFSAGLVAFNNDFDTQLKIWLAWYGLTSIGLVVCRSCIRIGAGWLRNHGYNKRMVAVAGDLAAGQMLMESFRNQPWLGFEVVGVYHDPKPGGVSNDWAGNLQQLVEDAKAGKIHNVYIAMQMCDGARVKKLVHQLADTTCSVLLIPDVFTFNILHSRLEEMNGVPVVPLYDTPLSGVNRLLKRAEDIVLATLILLLISPVLLLCVVGLLRSVGNPIGSLLMAKARVDISFKFNVFKTFLFIPAIVIGGQMAGAIGVTLGFLLVQIINTILSYFVMIKPVLGSSYRQYILSLWLPFYLSLPTLGVSYALGIVLKGQLALGMLLAVQIAAGVLAFVVMIVLSRHPLVVEVKRQFCRSEKMKMLLRAG